VRLVCTSCHTKSNCQGGHLLTNYGQCAICGKGGHVVECGAKIEIGKMQPTGCAADVVSGDFQGKPWTKDVVREGARNCGECGRMMKVYQRRLSAPMAKGLIKLHFLHRRHPDEKGFHISEIFRDRGDFAKLRFWGLIQELPNTETTKKSSGVWRITTEGKLFVTQNVWVPLYVTLRWGNEHVGFAGPRVKINETLGKKFDYEELMSSDYWTSERALA
jgi:hypothetical protein